MALKPRLELRQTQSLVMTPQLRQALKMLQMSTLELGGYLAEQIEANPLIELADGLEPADLRQVVVECLQRLDVGHRRRV